MSLGGCNDLGEMNENEHWSINENDLHARSAHSRKRFF